MKVRHYCQAMKRIHLVLYLKTELFFLSKLQSPIHRTCTCLCFHQGNKVRGRNTGYIPSSFLFMCPLEEFNTKFKHRWKTAGTCTFIRGCISLLYEEELPYVWMNPLLYWSTCSLWWVDLGQLSGTYPTAPCPPQQHMGKKIQWKSSWVEIKTGRSQSQCIV